MLKSELRAMSSTTTFAEKGTRHMRVETVAHFHVGVCQIAREH
jgi:hypothetical protein